jgi:hypothetical protein
MRLNEMNHDIHLHVLTFLLIVFTIPAAFASTNDIASLNTDGMQVTPTPSPTPRPTPTPTPIPTPTPVPIPPSTPIATLVPTSPSTFVTPENPSISLSEPMDLTETEEISLEDTRPTIQQVNHNNVVNPQTRSLLINYSANSGVEADYDEETNEFTLSIRASEPTEEVNEEKPENTNQVSRQVEESDNNDDVGNGDNGEEPFEDPEPPEIEPPELPEPPSLFE